MSIESGVLYVVATPIGNLDDITTRALKVLNGVDKIACEDTRHSGRLLRQYGIGTATLALHEHNERKQVPRLLKSLREGSSLALISDAGTPLVSDPGFHLVRAAQEAGIRVVPIPGASALLAALSAAGLPTDRFVFEGFLPSKAGARQRRLAALSSEERTLVFFESPHRIEGSLADMEAVFGAARKAAIARELTKVHETVRTERLDRLARWVREDPEQRLGEMVVVLEGAPPRESDGLTVEQEALFDQLAAELPLKQAASLAARITGGRRKLFYRRGLESKEAGDG